MEHLNHFNSPYSPLGVGGEVGAWGVIFDMDGTMIDNNPYHLKAWQAFCANHEKILTEEDFKINLSGKNNTDTLNFLFNDHLPEEKLSAYKLEKETLYRELYASHVAPIKGLTELLNDLHRQQIPMAIATSGTPVNIDFAMKRLPFANLFSVIVDSTQIKKGKPDPEIYFTAAALLKLSPRQCIVFEDSLTGIQGAKAAGMKIIAITTAHNANELPAVNKIIDDYTSLSVNDLQQLING